MISVTNVPPVLDSQINSPVIAIQAEIPEQLRADFPSLEPALEQPIELGGSLAAAAPAGAHPATKAIASLRQAVTLLQPSVALSKSEASPKTLVKNISLWSAGVSRNLKLDLPLLAVLKAENPRSALPVPASVQPTKQPIGSNSSSAAAAIEAGAEASVVEKKIENKGEASAEAASSVAEPNDKNCLAADELLPKAAFPSVFQVQMKGHAIAYLPTQAAAETLEQQINQLLQAPRFDPNTLSPALVNGVPVGKAGDTVLFEITPDLAASFDRNPTLLAIAWINQLRITLGAAPIALADAQSQMYHLLPSNKQLKGNASWYDPAFEGSPTATGETFDSSDLTAAHPTLPFGTYLKVTNQQTSDSVIVRVNDRGPYLSGRSLDVSSEAARCLNSQTAGVVPFQAVIMETPQPQVDQTAIEQNPEASQQNTVP
jgi:Lytic transglycolase